MDTREELNKKFLELDALPENFSREDAQKRGYEFEALIQKLLSAVNILRRGSYHTSDGKSEQIDGSVNIEGIRAIIEVKWVNSGLAASALYSFIGKVEGKFIGTIGIFISRVELTDNFLKSLRTGRRQSVIVIHGDDLKYIFEPTFPVTDYILAIIDHLSCDNDFHLSAENFLSRKERISNGKTKSNPLIKKALSNRDYSNVIYEWVENLNINELLDLVSKITETYLGITDSGDIERTEKINLMCLVEEAIKKLPEEEVASDWPFFEELSTNFVSSQLLDFVEIFSHRFKYLPKEKSTQFGKRLSAQWNKVEGNYDSENKLAYITEFVWESLRPQTKKSLIKIFISFIDSGRRPNFPQMQLAHRILSNIPKKITHPITKEILKENIRYWFEDDRKEKDWKEKMPKWYARKYSKWEQYLNSPLDDVITEIIEELITEDA